MEHPTAQGTQGYTHMYSNLYDRPNRYRRRSNYPSFHDRCPAEDARFTGTRPTGDRYTGATVKVLVISSDGYDYNLSTVPLLDINDRIPKEEQSNKTETFLRYVPNIWITEVDPSAFKSRSLVTVSAAKLGSEWKEDYFMYKCNHSCGGPKTFIGGRVYGPLVIFRMQPDSFVIEQNSGEGSARSGAKPGGNFTQRPDYVDMDYDFANGVAKRWEAANVVELLARS